MENDLFQQVQKALAARRGEWKQIAAAIPEVSYSWIAQVGRGKYASKPLYDKLIAVDRYLRGGKSA